MDQWGDGWAVLEQAAELKRHGESFALATVVWRQGPTSGKQGCRAIITEAGDLHGWIGGACSEPIVIREAQKVIDEGVPRLLLLGTSDQFGAAIPDGIAVTPIACQSEGALEVYIEPVVPTPHLVVVGRSPMAHTLVELAQALGWDTNLVDSPDFSSDFSLDSVTEHSFVVVATQGHGDEEAIQKAAAAHPAYLGLVASRKRGESVLGYLSDQGIGAEQLHAVRVPAGLDLGHVSHREMAVGILAELVQLRASGAIATSSGSRQEGKSGVTVETVQAAEAVDPVCGMTIKADASAYPYEYEGATYYFCCAGCRRAFEKDPAAYVKEEARC